MGRAATIGLRRGALARRLLAAFCGDRAASASRAARRSTACRRFRCRSPPTSCRSACPLLASMPTAIRPRSRPSRASWPRRRAPPKSCIRRRRGPRASIWLCPVAATTARSGPACLLGWTARGDRPSFRIVTGTSTGALSAPFAFLGPEYDPQLKAVYTETAAKDIFSAQAHPGRRLRRFARRHQAAAQPHQPLSRQEDDRAHRARNTTRAASC